MLDLARDDSAGIAGRYRIKLGTPGTAVTKTELVDLMKIDDPDGISGTAANGDIGLGPVFAMPFNTIEDIVVLDERTLLVIDDNNFPFSVGRHKGSGAPDDNELVRIRLPKDRALTLAP